MSYGELMREYARQRGLRRAMIPVPVLTPHLSSLWLGLVTPVYARVGRELVEGMRNETVVRDPAPARDLLGVRPRGMRDGDRPRARQRGPRVRGDALVGRALVGPGAPPLGAAAVGSRLVDSRVERVPVPPAVAFAPIRRIGGRRGWYYGNVLWRLRGLLDLPFGGAGMRRGRRDPERLLPGDTVDSWRVEAIEEDRLLRLAAEMWVPGRAWLQFEVEPDGDGSVIRQTAVFDPAGILGRAYWYAIAPLHGLVFRGMVRGIARAATAPRPATRSRGGPRVSAPRIRPGRPARRLDGGEPGVARRADGAGGVPRHPRGVHPRRGRHPPRPRRPGSPGRAAASARAWMRHLAQALAAELPGAPPDLPERLTVWMNANGERLEALVLEEQAVLRAARRLRRPARPTAATPSSRRNARLFAEGCRDAGDAGRRRGRSPAEFGRASRVVARRRGAPPGDRARGARGVGRRSPPAGPR